MKNQIQMLSDTRTKSGKFGASRRILAVTHGTLLDEGVVNLLTHKPDLEIWGVDKDNEAALVHAASQIRPDVLLIFHTHPDEQKQLLQQLESCPTLKRLTIIIVHLNNNSLYVHCEQEWVILDGGSFFPLIEGHNGRPKKKLYKKSPLKLDATIKPAIRWHELLGLQKLFPT